jgi:hypothetical protein
VDSIVAHMNHSYRMWAMALPLVILYVLMFERILTRLRGHAEDASEAPRDRSAPLRRIGVSLRDVSFAAMILDLAEVTRWTGDLASHARELTVVIGLFVLHSIFFFAFPTIVRRKQGQRSFLATLAFLYFAAALLLLNAVTVCAVLRLSSGVGQ